MTILNYLIQVSVRINKEAMEFCLMCLTFINHMKGVSRISKSQKRFCMPAK